MKESNLRPEPKRPEEEEVAHYDDAVIGRAFRWSALAAVLALVVAGTLFLLFRRKPAAPAVHVTPLTAPVAQRNDVVEIPEVRFTDVTAQSGIQFKHENGAYGEKLLPETMGGAAAFFDFNNDGAPDLLFVNGRNWPGHATPGQPEATPVLYQNDGKGHYANVTANSGLDKPIYGMGIATGDFDNDGLVDVFISGVGENRLYKNLGNGKFRDATQEAGLQGDAENWSTACSWFDYDNDGRLDLFVGHYVKWSKEIDLEVGYKIVGVGRAYGQPMNFAGTFPSLYHNDGNGHFTDVSAQAGFQIKNPSTGAPAAKTLGVAPIDLDGDGWMDLIVANDTVQNFVFHNQKNGTFKEIGAVAGVAFDSFGAARGAMGIDTARFRNDDSIGIAVGNFANEMTALYVAQGAPLVFADEAITAGVGPASRLWLKFGVFFFDYDLDGRLDLLTANGHLEEEINKVQQSQHYAQPAQLFWNCGPDKPATFQAVPIAKAGADLFKPIVGRGSAFADIDGDGDLDILLLQTGGTPLLLRNDQNLGHHWLKLKLQGSKSNRDAIGAWVKVRSGGQTMQRQIMPTKSYLSQSELPITIGLGKNQMLDEVTVIWPGGQTQKLENPKIDSLMVVQQLPN
jgi:hypothetical protein